MLLALLCLAGAGAAAWYKAHPVPPRAPVPATHFGFYTERIHPRGLAVDGMTPTLLSPLRRELPSGCPPALDYRAGEEVLSGLMLPYFRAIGDLDFGTAPEASLACEVAGELRETWRSLRALAEGPVTDPPVRILVKHYPRPELAGNCVAIHVSFYTVPDPHIDPEARFATEPPDHILHGVLVEFHRTYQLEGGAPRLIAASVEVDRRLRHALRRDHLGRVLGREAGPVARDPASVMHFESIGWALRFGFAWFDRAAGLGTPDPWDRVFRSERDDLKTEPLTPDVERALRTIVERT